MKFNLKRVSQWKCVYLHFYRTIDRPQCHKATIQWVYNNVCAQLYAWLFAWTWIANFKSITTKYKMHYYMLVHVSCCLRKKERYSNAFAWARCGSFHFTFISNFESIQILIFKTKSFRSLRMNANCIQPNDHIIIIFISCILYTFVLFWLNWPAIY